MTTKYGLFRDPSFLAVGDQFHAEVVPERQKGPTPKVPVAKTGKGNDATFSKFLPLFHGCAYEDGRRCQAMNRITRGNPTPKSAKGKHVNDNDPSQSCAPFKPISPLKHSAAPGDFCGTFGGRVAYIPSRPRPPKKKGDVKPSPPNIYTNPPKRGGMGYNRITISQLLKGAPGVVGEYMYMEDPLTLIDAANRKAKEVELLRRVGGPFRPNNPGKKGTYGMPKTNLSGRAAGTVGEYEYTLAAINPLRKEDKTPPPEPFVPSSVPSSWKHATITPPPPYIELATDSVRKNKKTVAANRAREDAYRHGAGDWKPPPQVIKTIATPSIVAHRLNA